MLNSVIGKVSQVFQLPSLPIQADREDEFADMTELESLNHLKTLLSKIDLLQKQNIQGKVQLVLDTDEKAYEILEWITPNYLISLKDVALKKMVQGAVHGYLGQLNTTYTLMISDYQNQNTIGFDAEKIHYILMRSLNAIFLMAKWRYFDDQAAPIDTWANVHKIIRIAESLPVMNKGLFLYDSQQAATSIASLLERGLMLDTLQKENYTPAQFEITDRVLKAWTSNPVISNKFKEGEYQFFLHLDNESRPQRLRNAKHCEDFRYWKTSTVVDLIETYLCAATTNKSLATFNLNDVAPTQFLVELFKKLRVDWCVKGYKRQRRKDERTQKRNELNVCYGIGKIFDFANKQQDEIDEDGQEVETITLDGNDGASFYMANTSGDLSMFGLENWTMVEESPSGFGVELGKDINSLIQKGALVGYTDNTNTNTISVAEIKNIKKTTKGRYRVGLNKVAASVAAMNIILLKESTGPASVAINNIHVDENAFTSAKKLPALLVDVESAYRLSVITSPDEYARGNRFKMNIAGQDHLVLAGDVVSKQRDWVRFELIIKSRIN